MENAGIIIDRISDHECYITFKRTGLVISVDDATEEELVSMWNEKDAYALPPSNIEYAGGHDEDGYVERFKPNSWKKDGYVECFKR